MTAPHSALKGLMTNNKTKIKYRLTWKSDTQRTRKEAYFSTCTTAEEWYDEKLKEGKKPQLWMEETTTVLYKLK